MKWSEHNFLNAQRKRASDADKIRQEKPSGDPRNPFESDFGRVIFSPACRRLHDKTQVFPMTTDDNIHSRLTHSMEVMNIGLSFAINLCENKSFQDKTELSNYEIIRKISPILKTSCLVHDIGNPPFGHFGEEVIQDYFAQLLSGLDFEMAVDKKLGDSHPLSRYIISGLREVDVETDDKIEDLRQFLGNLSARCDYTEFDGNAEGFRVLTKLQYLGDLKGLNLTYATLASTLKYPNFGKKEKRGRIAVHKHGIFHTEKDLVENIANVCNLRDKDVNIIRHPLSFLMEAADSICYYLMDIEDAVQKHWITLADVKKAIDDNLEEERTKCIDEYFNRFKGENPSIQKEWVSYRTALLTYLMGVATNNFVNKLEEIENGKYNCELIEDNDNLYKVLRDISQKKILAEREITSLELTGQAVITGIFDAYIKLLFHPNKSFRKRGKSQISRSIFMTTLHEYYEKHKEDDFFKKKYNGEKNLEKLYGKFDVADFTVEERFRIVRDFVACMTDKFAVKHYQKLSGQKI